MAIKAASFTNQFISATEFKQRRQHLAQQCGPGSIVIVPAAPEVLRNNDAYYPYRQNSDFVYLTGFEEPDAIMVLIIDEDANQYHLFVREKDPQKEVWTGPRAGIEGAKRDYGADAAFLITEFDDRCHELLKNRDKVYFPLGQNEDFERRILHHLHQLQEQLRAGVQAPHQLQDVKATIAEMRLFKSDAEIKAIQAACDITVQAHQRAMCAAKPGMMEYEIEAEIQHEFYRHGSRFPAYNSIVGAGENACVLHYIDNNAKIEANDLILIDAGAEIGNYAADVTRTFPASGQFSQAQKQIYDIVLQAQSKIIAAIKPGCLFSRMQEIAVEVIVDGLLELNILQGDREQLIEEKHYQRFYMHRSGHWLGLDVHDVGAYTTESGAWRELQPGMVLTVEPGIYISAGADDVEPKWWNIGVRIEDDVLVTASGARVLTEAAPRTIAAIEALMASAREA